MSMWAPSYAICGRLGSVQMFANVEQLMPDAAHSVVPRTNDAPVGDTRTTVYAIGQKSFGIDGNCGHCLKAPTVVVTPGYVSMTGPWAATSVPAAFTPKTIAAALSARIVTGATPVFASVVGVSDWLLFVAKAVVNFPPIAH